MASATVPAKVKTSKAALVDDEEYEGPSRSTVVTVLALLVGVLSLVDYFLHGFGAAVAHLAYFGGVVLVFRVFFALAFRASDTDSDTEPEASP
jgi:small neutral amino acid transporter SnatA (MarC family)